MDKTIKEIADALGVDKQRVYRYVKKHHITEAYHDAQAMYFDEVAQNAIKKAFSENEAHHEKHQDRVNDAVYDALLKQLDAKDEQIRALQEALLGAQRLQALAEQKLMMIEDKKSPGLWSRAKDLFKNK